MERFTTTNGNTSNGNIIKKANRNRISRTIQFFLQASVCLLMGILTTACGSDWGFGGGPDSTTEVVFVDLNGGTGAFYDTDGAGGFMSIRNHEDWYTGWEHVIAGDFGGDAQDDLLLADFDRGLGSIALSRGEGELETLFVAENWYRGWDTVVAGNFDGEGRDDLLFLDFQATSESFSGLAIVYSLDESGAMSQVSHHDNWFTGWDAAVAGDFVATGDEGLEDIVLADFDQGYLAVARNDGTGHFAQVSFLDDLGGGWDQLLTGDFDGNDTADVLIIDFDSGTAAFYASDGQGGLSLMLHQDNWWRGWDTAAVGDFGSSSHSDIMLLDRSAGTVGVYATDGTARQTQLAFREGFSRGTDLIVTARPRTQSLYSYPDPKEFTQSEFEGSMAPSEDHWVGELPAVMILMGEPVGSLPATGPVFTRTPEDFRRDMFGPSDVNLAGYFDEVSDGLLQLVPADMPIVGPLPVPTISEVPTGAGYGERYRTYALNAAASAGFDFTRYDRNGDGRIEDDELFVIINTRLTATPEDAVALGLAPQGAGGTVRATAPGCFSPTGQRSVDLCLGNVGAFSDGVGLRLIAHEITHMFGAKDLYMTGSGPGSGYCSPGAYVNNMTCPWFGTIPHMDPWHKLQIGWETAKAYRMNEPGSCVSLADQSSDSTFEADVAILWDPRRGSDEYFILEHRNPTSSDYDDGLERVGLDGSGLAVWNVVTSETGGIVPIPALIQDPGSSNGGNGRLDVIPHPNDIVRNGAILAGPDRVLDTVLPSGSNDVVRSARWVIQYGADAQGVGEGRPWVESDGAFRLKWSDGTDAGVVLQVKESADDLKVAWSRGDLMDQLGGGLEYHGDMNTGSCYEEVLD